VSYHQKKSRPYFCSRCGIKDRSVEFQPLLGDFLHYECWLEVASENIGRVKKRVDADRFNSDVETPTPTDHPFKPTAKEWEQTSLPLWPEED